jgi:hypothetical protein
VCVCLTLIFQDADLPIPMGLDTPSHITLARTFVPVLLPDSVMAELKRQKAFHLLTDHVDPTFLRVLSMEHLQRIKSCWRVADVRQLYSPRADGARKLSCASAGSTAQGCAIVSSPRQATQSPQQATVASPSPRRAAVDAKTGTVRNPVMDAANGLSSSLAFTARLTLRLGLTLGMAENEATSEADNVSSSSG